MLSSKYLAVTREFHCTGQSILYVVTPESFISKTHNMVCKSPNFLFEENLTLINASITVTPNTVYSWGSFVIQTADIVICSFLTNVS